MLFFIGISTQAVLLSMCKYNILNELCHCDPEVKVGVGVKFGQNRWLHGLGRIVGVILPAIFGVAQAYSGREL